MSYITFQQQCQDCKATWNTAFGIVGITFIATTPVICPKCGSANLTKFADGWDWTVVDTQAMEDSK